ncbi:MAG: phosphotransferase [Pseudomonadota bacterium]
MNRLFPTTLISQIAPVHREMLQECHSVGLLARLFADSTHQAWSCSFQELKCVLKVCAVGNVKSSSFWQTMEALFAFDFVESIGQYTSVYQQVNEMTPLEVPRLMAAVSASHDKHSGFLLTAWVDGAIIDPNAVEKGHVEQLARHIAALHQYNQASFGPLFAPHLPAERWAEQVSKTLQDSASMRSIDFLLWDKALAQLAHIHTEAFHPIMPDLRWDQFLVTDTGALCLIDLDAMVWGPRALELVLLEYLLNEKQLALFKAIYTQSHTMPDLDSVRQVYRLLLFVMNVLGETDLARWMAHPGRFL